MDGPLAARFEGVILPPGCPESAETTGSSLLSLLDFGIELEM